MKKKSLIIVIILMGLFTLVLGSLLLMNINSKADVVVTTVEGARIRKDEKVGLLFEGKATSSENLVAGFIIDIGEKTKEELLESTTKKDVEAIWTDKETFTYAIVLNDSNDYEVKYSALAYIKSKDQIIYASASTTRSIMQVAKNLGKGYSDYVDQILNHQAVYYDTTVTLYPSGGIFEDSTTGNKILNLKDPTNFPVITKEGYKFMGWKIPGSDIVYTSYLGTQKEGQSISFIAQWSQLPNASNLINVLLPAELTSEFEVSLEYEDKECVWSVEENDFITYSKGTFKVSDERNHYTNSVKVTLEYNGTKATKTYRIKPIELRDLSNTSPYAMYFAVGSLSNYINYGTHSINKLFEDEVKKELDIVYYAFASIDDKGNVSLYHPTQYDAIMEQLQELRKNGTRLVLSIAGTSDAACRNFNNICGDDTLRKTLVNNLINTIEDINFDGIDIDWESVSSTNTVNATKLNSLMKDLREEMDKRTGTLCKYLLTAAIPSTSWGCASDRFDLKTLNNYLDYVNMMSYDLNSEEKTSHVSPIYTSSYDNGYKFSSAYGVDLFTKMGLDKKKIILGGAAYGKAYKVTGTSTNKTYPGLGVAATLTKVSGISGSYASGTMYYNGVLELMKNSNYKQYTEYNSKGEYVGNYLYSEKDGIFVSYEGEEMISLKAEYARTNGMGIMMWSYCEDGSGNLCLAIAKTIHKK